MIITMWLCLKKCIHARQEVIIEKRPIYAGSYRTHKVECLRVYYEKKFKNVKKRVTSCSYYAKFTLE